jgi:hypothetical protein
MYKKNFSNTGQATRPELCAELHPCHKTGHLTINTTRIIVYNFPYAKVICPPKRKRQSTAPIAGFAFQFDRSR